MKRGESMDDFEQVYIKYYNYVNHYVMSLCFDVSLAEEITQEAFVKALQKYRDFRGDCRPETWICRIAHNIYIETVRKHPPENIDDYTELTSHIRFEENSEDAEAVRAVMKALTELEPPYKDVFYMKAVGDMPYSLIAEIFGKTESWVRVTYFRARAKIAERMNTDE